ncbi:uncharacterized protein AMSG_03394 [Thecamonas trahens ATCC 50062]|uniref:Fungal lipase-type domain-containing protein n=1 Tax=Thecamonas trahens ATCC 50062 TaxID=461836 RepID=A0A0L0D4C6_THETB|nr:hypothetical protein AMSG_03394 [Thecamonas trahens ATCC 50062]KNC46961.1 hypothetical protein AMSG_03394 [Thecamonas trahens ATCC 50062]|eukprot:XP_013760232.1 hypothetical protein AMSG_03394 [Thecamonas trahens ATCC 50062]
MASNGNQGIQPTLGRLARVGAYTASAGLFVSRWGLALSSTAASSALGLSSLLASSTALVVPSLLPGGSAISSALSAIALGSWAARTSITASSLSAQSSLLALELALRTGSWAAATIASVASASSSAPAPAATDDFDNAPLVVAWRSWERPDSVDRWLRPAMNVHAWQLDVDILQTAIGSHAAALSAWTAADGNMAALPEAKRMTLALWYAAAHAALEPSDARSALGSRLLSGGSAVAALALLHQHERGASASERKPRVETEAAPATSSSWSSWLPWRARASQPRAAGSSSEAAALVNLGRMYMPLAIAAYGEAALIKLSAEPEVAAAYPSFDAFVSSVAGDELRVVRARGQTDGRALNYAVLEDTANSVIVVAIAAPRSLDELVTSALVKPPLKLDDANFVAREAHELAVTLRDEIGPELARLALAQAAPATVVVAGHSLGGSVAALLALYLVEPMREAAPAATVRALAYAPLPFVSHRYAIQDVVRRTVVVYVATADALPRLTASHVAARVTAPLVALATSAAALVPAILLGEQVDAGAALLPAPTDLPSLSSPGLEANLVVAGTVLVVDNGGEIVNESEPGALAAGLTLAPDAFTSHMPQAYARALSVTTDSC